MRWTGPRREDVRAVPDSVRQRGGRALWQELAKAQLVGHIRDAIKRRHVTQAEAARRVGLDQPRISALMNGRPTGLSSSRLLRCLTMLGQEVDIVVMADTKRRARGRLRVISRAA